MGAARLSPRQREALKTIAEGRYCPALVREDDGWYARWRPLAGENDWVDEYVRGFSITRMTEDAEDLRHETLHDAWITALRSQTGRVVWDEAEIREFAAELVEWSGAAAADVAERRAIVFTLVADERALALETPIPHGVRAYKALGRSRASFLPLGGLRRCGDTLRLELTPAEAEEFVRSGARELEEAGYTLSGVKIEKGVAAEVELDDADGTPGASKMRLSITVAGEKVGVEELKFLLDQSSSLVFFRGRWIEVDRRLLRQALRALERQGSQVASPLSFALGVGRIDELEIAGVSSRGWLRGLVNSLAAASAAARASGKVEFSPPRGFTGTLRGYQLRGVMWMEFLTENGFGALLADDMGLGKSVQTIVWYLRLKEKMPQSRLLIVAPLTLISNWRHEFAKFAPELKVYAHQGERRHLGSGFKRAAGSADVVITSYGLLVRDYTEISETVWDAAVVDEAQNVKNPDTRAARSLKALLPRRRIALTGTPVENSAADVWALEDFLNPGFLGDRKSFDARFVKPIAFGCTAAADKLTRALEPFVLRRLKGERGVAAELGPKREIREYCRLSAAERREYEAALERYRSSERAKADAFALITRLKLICDGESKLERLAELLENIFAAGESALVFTQYAKVGRWLQEALKERFGRIFPFLHGSLALSRREAEIARFNRMSAGAFIISLKAGGVGLNLTKATHVIHFDRWWNPAVENQATDRAHRIGQKHTVLVHLFITSGTLEEHIDEILARKTKLASSLIGGGENFLAQLEARELISAVSLSDD